MEKMCDLSDLDCGMTLGARLVAAVQKAVLVHLVYLPVPKIASHTLGSAARPVLTFRPNYSLIFKGEKMRMNCDSQPTEKDYNWFHNNGQIWKGEVYEIPSAQISQSGNYQCQTKDGSKSEMVTLNVTEGQVILQAPPYIHEGDRLLLKCHHDTKLDAKQSTFYKDKAVIRAKDKDPLFTKTNINRDASGLYSCIKEISQDSKNLQYSASASIYVRELFTTPELRVTQKPGKGKNLIMTCYANVSLYKPTTEMLYGFHKGENIFQTFNPSNRCEVRADQLVRSDKFDCAVRPKTSSVTKKSKQINPSSTGNKAAFAQNIIGLALYECVLIISFTFVFST
ncbi:high affinity immunoglobulin gamma Fc receptor I-like [Mantella aurantiaca]